MQVFKINEYLEVVCEAKKTSYGFKHVATLFLNGIERGSAKCTYYNRTWERYEFESVLEKLADGKNILSDREKKLFKKKIANQFKKDDPAMKNLKMVAGIMALGNVFGADKKEKNDWKVRMLKAGLDSKGLIMPDNWDELNEEEKEARLNGVINQLK